jgi:DNA primase
MIINEVEFNATLEEILEELRSQLRVNNIELLQKMKSSGNDIMVQCPYHGDGKEKRPSAGISKKNGQFHCFACGEVHNLPEVISYCFGKDDRLGVFGWNWLLKNFLTVNVQERKGITLDFSREKTVEQISYVSEEELESYRFYHPYMYTRKLTNDIIDLFDIGYDKKTESITFPVRDISGNCLFVARRSVKTKWFNYPAGVEKPLYGLYELYSLGLIGKYNQGYDTVKEIIVCESMLDALTCWVYGKYAVAMNGLGSELQFKQLRELSCRKLILATDNDDAGKEARKRIRQKVKNKLITEYILPSDKKDINELSKEEFDTLQEVF